MPRYEYKREDGTTFTLFQRFEEDPLNQCPDTGQQVSRIISGGLGTLLPVEKTVKYRDGKFVSRDLAKKLEKDPFYTTLEDKRKRLERKADETKQRNAEIIRKATGRITEI